ncbi:MAG: NAD(P)/FAD-dependent oxidoreductase [Flavobacteriales bacterium]|nr:NAD(P)/FAD-dependent oxidoreductase [Flavobacteriales bacterium]
MKERSVTILGGGITGLASAYLLARNGVHVRVVEGSDKFGGLLNTFSVGGGRLEHFYHHFFTHDAEINWLLNELGLQEEVVFRKTSMGVHRDGHAYDFNSPMDVLRFTPMSWVGRARFAATSLYLGLFGDWRSGEDEAALDWFRKYAGKNVTDALWRPMLEIKFGPYHDQVPIAWMMGRLSQRMRSRRSGEELLGYLKGSLQMLLDRLMEDLARRGVEMIAEAPVERIELRDGRMHAVHTPKGTFTDEVFLATMPTIHLAPVLEHAGILELAKDLRRIGYFGAVCGILEMDRPLGQHYWLNVADPGYPFGGVIEQTLFIRPENYGGRHIAYLSRYFAPEEDIANMDEPKLRELFLSGVERLHPGFKRDQVHAFHLFRTRTAATICDLRFSEKVPPCRTSLPGLFLANMAHVYPDERSVNNSIRVAAEAVRTMGHDTAMVPKGRSLSGQIGFGAAT